MYVWGIFWLWVLLSIFRCSLVLSSAGSGVNSVQVVLSKLSMGLLSFVHVCICCRYCCCMLWLCFWRVCVDGMVMASAYKVSCCGTNGCGMSDM